MRPRGKISLSAQATTSLAFQNPLEIINRDFKALTRKVTAYHILLPKSTEVALTLKQKIRNAVSGDSSTQQSQSTPQKQPMYIVDAFSAAAKKYSRDDETAIRGGLLGTLVPQGYCRAKELDEACFNVPLGVISGPVESEYGYHLLLVVERTNCPNLDGEYTKIVRNGQVVGAGNHGDGADSSGGKRMSAKFINDASNQEYGTTDSILRLVLQQVGFWMAVTFAGGFVAEIAAKAAHVVEELPWE